jgi:hypothetical protein
MSGSVIHLLSVVCITKVQVKCQKTMMSEGNIVKVMMGCCPYVVPISLRCQCDFLGSVWFLTWDCLYITTIMTAMTMTAAALIAAFMPSVPLVPEGCLQPTLTAMHRLHCSTSCHVCNSCFESKLFQSKLFAPWGHLCRVRSFPKQGCCPPGWRWSPPCCLALVLQTAGIGQ